MAGPTAARGALALAVAAVLARPGAGGTVADKSDAGFRIVGSGACRTAKDGPGTYESAELVKNATDCERVCAEDNTCVAYEVTYDVSQATFEPSRVKSCEIHKEAIMKSSHGAGGHQECWVKEGSGRKSDYELIGTGYCLPASLERFRIAAWDFAPPGSFDHHYQCRTACDAEASCTAYELRKDGNTLGCKLYTDPITQVEHCEKGRDCWCWVAKPIAKPASAGGISSMEAEIVS